ncbi:MFS transporter [Bailinhaonella thermotolerans]|uniref:MFS transporter n=1 Tax=Bailinhaonella thermotolerans TaxID=1070861 RepID=A0A3A4AQG1_9ACTN|nr:MFS transporter [Bailinhaonella thermotolerans]RJL31301.1 MFS transporter [Bailinhaonella thermotolerans]
MTLTQTPRLGASLGLLAFANLITSLDFTIVYVALPDIARDAGFSVHSIQWVVSAYAVVFGGFLLLGGRLSDLLGRRRLFAAGMLLYGGASLLGGLAEGPGTLIAARALQGLGGAILAPATLALVNTMFTEHAQRTRALTVWATGGAAGLSLGALLGGALTSALGWEWVFFVNVPLAALGLVAAPYLLVPDAPRARGTGFDLPGALTGTGGVTLLVFAIAQGPETGWGSPTVLGAAVAGLVLLTVFVRIEGASRHPLLPLRLFRERGLPAAAGVILLFGLTLQAVPYFLTLYFQDVLGYDALRTGVGFLGPTLTITLGNTLSDRLIPRFGTRATLVSGLLTGGAGAALLAAGMRADGSYLTVLAGIVVVGLGMGLIYPAMFNAAGGGVAPGDAGVASGLANTALQVGSGAGLAVLVAVATASLPGLTGEPLREATASGLATAGYVAAAGVLLAVPAALRVPSTRRP